MGELGLVIQGLAPTPLVMDELHNVVAMVDSR